MKGLTRRQQEILDYISTSIQGRGYPPTIREIGKHMGIRSTNGVNDHLKALERKGFLTRDDLKSRAIRPIGGEVEPEEDVIAFEGATDDDLVDVPVLGRVAAGAPILAVEDAEDRVRIDRVLLGGRREVFALRICGDSMIEDGIFDGDFVFIEKTPSARPGEIVIVLIEDEATCKRFYPEGDRIRLQPANSAMAPIYIHKSHFRQTQIMGRVVGVYRQI
jgi:repressor LexA